VDAKDVEVTIYADETIISDYYLIPLVKAENSVELSFEWIAVPHVQHIRIVLDLNNSIIELNETNNEVFVIITVYSKPDLIPLNIQLTEQHPAKYDNLVISSAISNTGETEARNVLVSVFVDSSPLSEVLLESIPGGETRTIYVEWSPRNQSYTIEITVDPYDTISESNEENNEISRNIQVQDPYAFPSIELHSPNGGETLMNNTNQTVTYEASGVLAENPINLYYSVDGGTNWQLMAADQENTGYFKWYVPKKETEMGLVKVTVLDVFGNNISDVSDRTFAIDPPPGGGIMDRVISPSSGSEFVAGEEVMISWKFSDEDTISIFYSIDFGQTWVGLVYNISNFGLFEWEIPANIVSDNVVILIQGENGEISSGFFTINSEQDQIYSKDESDDGYGWIERIAYSGWIVIAIAAILIYLKKLKYIKPDNPGEIRQNNDGDKKIM